MEKELLRLVQTCVGLVVLLAFAILFFWQFPKMNSEVGAGWAAAFFTGLAFGGTIWIATSQRRAAEREAKSLAAITLFSMQFRLNNHRRQLVKLAVALDKWRPGDSHRIDGSAASKMIMQDSFLCVEDVEKILPLDEEVARGMAAAIDFVAHCVGLLETANSNPKVKSDEMFERFCGEMSQILANAAMCLRAAGVLSARHAGRKDTEFEDNGIPEIAMKRLPSLRN